MTEAFMTQAEREVASVTKDGAPLGVSIAGVKTHAPVNHVDHRGRVFELFPEMNEYWTDPIVYSYCFSIRPNQIKGWAIHERKSDRYSLIWGEVMVLLYDARTDSPTQGLAQRVALTEQGTRQLTIPPGVWHLNANLAPTETFLISFPTEPYHHDRPDRWTLPWHTDQIPVDVASYLPAQFQAPRHDGS